MQCFLKPHRQHYIPFLPAQYCPKSIKTTLNRSFSYAMLSGASRATLHRVLAMQCCPKIIKTTLHRIFSDAMLSGAFRTTLHWSIKTTLDRDFSHAMLSGASWAILHRVFSCLDIVPTVLRQHCTRLFLMHCCLELFGQHCIEFWPVQCCPKSIKAKLYRTFFYAILSGASRSTLRRIFICAMLSEEY